MIYGSAKSCRAIFFQVLKFNKLYFLCICLTCSGLSFSSDCTSLAKLKFGNISIASASVDAMDAELPVFCKIKGVVQPNIGFEARLPMKNWNGKFFQVGCGGFCGLIEPDRTTQSNAINHALAKGYAAITTDGGHQGKHLGDAEWARNNKEAEEVFAHKLIPLTYYAGHDLIQAFYKSTPTHSYFSGCSNGGRLAAKAAQEYPRLFDGIIAGCPVLNLTQNGGIFGSWVVQSNTNQYGQAILNEAFAKKVSMLEMNSLSQCDGLDGTIDGAIQKPNACHINLTDIQACKNGKQDDCLSDEERSTLRKLYRGPVNSNNEQLFYGINPGSERYLTYWYGDSKNAKRPGTLLADGYLPNLGLPIDDNSFSAMNFDFDKDPDLLKQQSKLLDALDTNLEEFQISGGKLLMWHGLADPLVLPEQTIEYYEKVTQRMGRNNVDTFFKLFLVPGMGHCWELPSALPDQMSMLSVLENWVEKNIDPSDIPITKLNAQKGIVRNGSLKPYPQMAIYN